MSLNVVIAVASVVNAIVFIVWFLTIYALNNYFWPKKLEICPIDVNADALANVVPNKDILKVLSWNVQFFAGTNYYFFYEAPPGKKKNIIVSEKDLMQSWKGFLQVVNKENPDVLLLQEVDIKSKRTRLHDQYAELRKNLPQYPYATSAYYIKSSFHPDPYCLGPWRMKLVILSKYPIEKSERHQLSVMPMPFLKRLFYLKRCVLEATIRLKDDTRISIMNTHLDAFAHGSNTMERQVQEVGAILAHRSRAKIPWLIGGDFNLLPNTEARKRLVESEQELYNPKTEIQKLIKRYSVLPKKSDVEGALASKWFTYASNNPDLRVLDRTTDYFFYSPEITVKRFRVGAKDTQDISDHVPLIGEFNVTSGR